MPDGFVAVQVHGLFGGPLGLSKDEDTPFPLSLQDLEAMDPELYPGLNARWKPLAVDGSKDFSVTVWMGDVGDDEREAVERIVASITRPDPN